MNGWFFLEQPASIHSPVQAAVEYLARLFTKSRTNQNEIYSADGHNNVAAAPVPVPSWHENKRKGKKWIVTFGMKRDMTIF